MMMLKALSFSLACAIVGCNAQRCDSERTPAAAEPQYVIPKRSSVVAIATPQAEDSAALKQGTEELTWTFTDTPLGRMDVVVVLPDRLPHEKFPILIALHGRGEALKGPVRGARGWVDDYALGRAIRRLAMPPLSAADFEGIAEGSRVKLLNEQLSRTPYRGMVVLCPYTPDFLSGDKAFESAIAYARFLVDTLLPRARRELPVEPSPLAVGIDGVSLGGRISLLSGLYEPLEFGVVGALQAAFDSADAQRLARMAREAQDKNPHLQFRLLTSTDDYFLKANKAIAAAFAVGHVKHELLIIPGPHDYVFNRGPGAIEMLLYHDRALRGMGVH